MKFELEKLIFEFNQILATEWNPSGSLKIEAESFLSYLEGKKGVKFLNSRTSLLKSINSKFDLNSLFSKNFFRFQALNGYTFNYHQKLTIRSFIDIGDEKGLIKYLSRDCDCSLNFFSNKIHHPFTQDETLAGFNQIYIESPKKDDICSSLFSAYIFNLCELQIAHEYFTGLDFSNKGYNEDFFDHLINYEPDLLKRKEGLRLLKIDDQLLSKYRSYSDFSQALFRYIDDSYNRLSNHSYLSIHVKISEVNSLKINKWELISDIEIFAEKSKERELKIGYFHPGKIEEITKKYIPLDDVDFRTVNEGFNFKDCFVLSNDFASPLKDVLSFESYDLLLLMEKNQRDERIVPCPACRSKNVRGNSYPTIGVKSWECYNQLCPEKSKFNRGKRYSLASLIRQEAINNEQNLIPPESVKKWRLDVTTKHSENEIFELLIRHYSLVHDTIVVSNYGKIQKSMFNRSIAHLKFDTIKGDNTNSQFLKEGSFFNRIYGQKPDRVKVDLQNISPVKGLEIYNEDSLITLQQFPSNTFDGAVTSPPYYNAKSYSQWPNLYCYLYDMHNINVEIYRVLKKGGIFLYNIFDYFDNENTVVFSDMGQKRLILGAYILNSFKRIGFEVLGNIVWFKGEIQGKRNFNQGNFSPYYQAPLNSYEHIFVLGKPGSKNYTLPQILAKKPVFKMIKGENVVGHEAPFPQAIPNLLFDILENDAKYVLDPFGGTMTTGKAALKRNIKSVCIERNLDYCQREINNLRKDYDNKALLQMPIFQ